MVVGVLQIRLSVQVNVFSAFLDLVYFSGKQLPTPVDYNFVFQISVLLSTACPTSLASDQTKGGGRPGVQRTPRFGAREQRFDLTKIQLSSKLSPKDPKEFAKKIREWRGAAPGKGRPTHHNTKGKSTETSRLYIYHTEKRSGRATPEIFLFFVCPLRGQFHSRRESSRRTSRLEGFC